MTSSVLTLDEIYAESLSPRSAVIEPVQPYGGAGGAQNLMPRYGMVLLIEKTEVYKSLILGTRHVLEEISVAKSEEWMCNHLKLKDGNKINEIRQEKGLDIFPYYVGRWALRVDQPFRPYLRYTREEQDGSSISYWLHRDDRHDMRLVEDLIQDQHEVFAEVRITASLQRDAVKLSVLVPQLHWREPTPLA